MTFSDSRVVKILQDDFIPAWESVAPVKIVTFDLGEGRSLKGTVSGEIAVYFCTPDGEVFDILPALQSPAATLATMKEALAFYQTHNGKLTDELVKDYHLKRMEKMAEGHFDRNTFALGATTSFGKEHGKSAIGLLRREDYIKEAVDAATRDLRTMSGSKVRTVGSDEEIVIVEPGGQGYFQWEVDRRFVNNVLQRIKIPGIPSQESKPSDSPPQILPLKTPDQWKVELFERVLRQPLKGGKVTYDSSSLEAIRIIGE